MQEKIVKLFMNFVEGVERGGAVNSFHTSLRRIKRVLETSILNRTNIWTNQELYVYSTGLSYIKTRTNNP